jgi:hypothetical protein
MAAAPGGARVARDAPAAVERLDGALGEGRPIAGVSRST